MPLKTNSPDARSLTITVPAKNTKKNHMKIKLCNALVHQFIIYLVAQQKKTKQAHKFKCLLARTLELTHAHSQTHTIGIRGLHAKHLAAPQGKLLNDTHPINGPSNSKLLQSATEQRSERKEGMEGERLRERRGKRERWRSCTERQGNLQRQSEGGRVPSLWAPSGRRIILKQYRHTERGQDGRENRRERGGVSVVNISSIKWYLERQLYLREGL